MLKRLLTLSLLCLTPPWTLNAHFLWRIETSPPSFLCGTVHSSDPAVRDIPATLLDSLATARSFHPELELSPENLGKMSAVLFSGGKQAWKLPASLEKRLNLAATKAGIPGFLLKRVPLQLLPLLFSAPPDADFNQIIDVQLYETAKASGKEIIQLETIDEQTGLFRNLSKEASLRLLDSTLTEFENEFPQQKALLKFYAKGDLEGLMELFKADLKTISLPELSHSLIDERNQRMADRLQPFLETGGAFVAVGLAHLPGENGIIRLLQQKGWEIQRIDLTPAKQQVPAETQREPASNIPNYP